jgi:hypothetical protein
MGAAGEGALPQAAQTRGHDTDACINDVDKRKHLNENKI